MLREDVDGVCGLVKVEDDVLRCRPCGLRFEGEPPVMRAVAGCGQGWVPRLAIGPPPTADRPKRRSFDRISARIADCWRPRHA